MLQISGTQRPDGTPVVKLCPRTQIYCAMLCNCENCEVFT